MATPEIWENVKGFESLYMVSNHGRVKSVDHYVKCNSGKRLVKGRILKPCDRGNGYPFVTVGKDGKQYNLSIHRAVAIAFIPNPDNLPEVNHKDTNPANANVSNLEWCNRTYNNNYDKRAFKAAKKKRKKIIQLDGNNVVKVWNSMSEIQKTLGFSIGNISSCCSGKRQFANGFSWKFVEV